MTNSSKVVTGTVWAAIDKFGTMGLSFIVNLVLANMLLPRDFGLIGMLSIFFAVANTFIDGGFLSALVQKKDATQTDYSTIFYWNTGFSVFCYAVIFFSAPYVAQWYSTPEVCPLLRFIGLTLVISAFNAVQIVRLRKAMAFRTCAILNISAGLVSGACAIVMAYNGFGVWSLAAMTVISVIAGVILYWISTGWRPSAVFSSKSFKELFGFGGFLLFANVLQQICQNLQGVIIGKRFSAYDTGLYTQSQKLEQVVSQSLSGVIVSVIFPLFSNIQEDGEKFKNVMETGIRLISGVVFPILVLFIIVGRQLVETLYGQVWAECVPYFRILCVGGFFTCLQNINFYAVAARGKSRTLFYWSFYKWGLLMALLLGGMFLGMEGIMWAIVLSNVNIFLVNALLVQRHVGFTLWRQCRTVLPVVILCVTGGILSIILEKYLNLNFLIIAIVFIGLYICALPLFRLRFFNDLRTIWQQTIRKKNK